MLTPDQKRVKELLCETIILLCKNGLHFQSEFCIDGLIGITLDQRDVFLVSLKETVKHGEMFIREQQLHPVRCSVAEELSNNTSESTAVTATRPEIHAEAQAGRRLATRCQSASSLAVPTAEVSADNLVRSSVSPPMIVHERLTLKTEEEISDKTDEEQRMTCNASETFNVSARKSTSLPLSSHCSASVINSTMDVEVEQNCAVNDSISVSFTQYDESGTVVGCQDEAKQSLDVNSRLSSDCSVPSLCSTEGPQSSQSSRKEEGDVRVSETDVPLQDIGPRKTSASRLDSEDADGEDLVVVKVEPPNTDYVEQFPSLPCFGQAQTNQAADYLSDTDYLCSRTADNSHFPVKAFRSMQSFEYDGQLTDANILASKYGQMNRCQMRLGMHHRTLPTEPSAQSPVLSTANHHKSSLVPVLSKPYGSMNYSNLISEMDSHDMFASMDTNSMTQNDMVLQTDVEKNAEMQNFCVNRRARSTFTAFQLQRLESAFRQAHYVDAATRSRLAEELNLSDTIILVWFQNRRQKYKKQMKTGFS